MPKCYKIVLLGSKKVGKTAIIEQLVHGHHNIGSVSKIIDIFWHKFYVAQIIFNWKNYIIFLEFIFHYWGYLRGFDRKWTKCQGKSENIWHIRTGKGDSGRLYTLKEKCTEWHHNVTRVSSKHLLQTCFIW